MQKKLNIYSLKVWVSVVVTSLLLLYQQNLFFSFFIDDSYISLVYVRNFLDGNGLTYNGLVVEGYSNFLWVVGVSLLSLLGLDIVFASKVLGILCSHLTLFVLMHLGCLLTNRWQDGLMASLLLIVMGPFVVWSVGGLESTLFALLLILMVHELYKECYLVDNNRLPYSAIVAFLLSITRPEGFGLVVVVCLWLMIIFYCGNRGETGSLYLKYWFAVYCISFGLFLLWRIMYYHDILPATVYAKQSLLQDQIRTGIFRLKPLLTEWRFAIILFVIGSFSIFSHKRKNYPVILLMIALIGAYVCFIILSGADWMPMHRFLVPLLPLAVLVGVSGVSSLIIHLTPSLPPIYHVFLLVVICALPFKQLYQWTENRREHTIEQGILTFNGPAQLGKQIRKIADDSTRIAVVDAGALAYYSEVPVLDMYGLNNQYIAHLPGQFGKRCDTEYVLDYEPTWIEVHYILTEEDHPIFVNFGCMHKIFYTKEFQRWYEIDDALPLRPYKRLDNPKIVTMMDDFYSSSIELIEPIYESQTNKVETGIVRLTNTGTGIWITSSDDHLGVVHTIFRLINNNTNDIVVRQKVPIPNDLLPYEKVNIPFTAMMPKEAGLYTLEIDLILSDIAFFSEHGNPIYQHNIQIY